MNKLFVSAGLVVIGAAALETAIADDISGPKYWSVGATLRGFYDDNINSDNTKQGSVGFEVLPNVSFHLPLQQTDLGLRYTYGLYYYEDRQEKGQDAIDQTHEVDLWLNHAFNERWKGKFTDTFAVGQEPELLTPNPVTGVATPYRVNGDNLANHGTLALDTDWTRLFSTTLSYNNGFYDYQNTGGFVDYTSGTPFINSPTGGATLAGLLNRDEESAALDLKWHLRPDTTVFVGYQLAWVNYTGDEPIAVVTLPSSSTFVYHSSDRDSVTHYGYLGVQEDFTSNLSATVRGGASYTDVYGEPLYSDTSWAPYADVAITYTYLPGSYVQFGFTHDISASDQISPDTAGRITDYAENSVIYADWNHRITSKLVASLIGRIQYSTYNGGAASSDDTTDYGVGINLDYQINNHLSVDAGYNYDDVESDIAGYTYDRNRVYIGLSANY